MEKSFFGTKGNLFNRFEQTGTLHLCRPYLKGQALRLQTNMFSVYGQTLKLDSKKHVTDEHLGSFG